MIKKGISEDTQPLIVLNEEQLQAIFEGTKPSIGTKEQSHKTISSLDAAHEAYGEQFESTAKKLYNRAYKTSGKQAEKTAAMAVKYTELAAKTLSKIQE